MNNYCINLKKRKNKPYCKLLNKEIPFSLCRECGNKEYRKPMEQKNSGFYSKIPVLTGKKAQSLEKTPPKKVKMRQKSNKLTELEKNRKSVFTDDLDYCYLCGKKKNDLHEVFGGRNRINSIKYNFILPLCRECHSSNQNNPIFNDYWHKQGQLYWEKNIGSREEFIKAFRRNYLK